MYEATEEEIKVMNEAAKVEDQVPITTSEAEPDDTGVEEEKSEEVEEEPEPVSEATDKGAAEEGNADGEKKAEAKTEAVN